MYHVIEMLAEVDPVFRIEGGKQVDQANAERVADPARDGVALDNVREALPLGFNMERQASQKTEGGRNRLQWRDSPTSRRGQSGRSALSVLSGPQCSACVRGSRSAPL